ncbi:MAG: TonB-dependent receptor [Phenylobacterium sp.]|uniref:TonB-dependent receptor n=1 Tax=Phenylobacterium sp. TaxID=1871053 RepID=UPI000ACAAF0E|nr:TonB-dependent receptor [Phenylobacterium sp.]MBA4793887.1 TonB-dependent receptor [Phenylobacterium sp.]
MKLKLAACASVAALCAGLSTGAAAQEAAATTQVDEIIVTGEKFGRNMQETATSVGYVSAEDIETSSMISGRDVFERLVNVNTAGANGRFAIRGVAFDNITGAGFGALGTLYVDNVRMSDKSTRFGPDLLWDVQSIEVLRGAQSTLQGRNALAGAIYIKSVDPSYDWQAKGRVIASDGGGQDYAVALGGPLIADTLAFRLSAERRLSDGFLENPVLGTDKVDYADDLQVRGKLLFEPTDDLTVRLAVNYADIDRRDAPSDTRILGANGYLDAGQKGPGFEAGVAGQDGAERRLSFVNVPEFDTTETWAGALTAEWRLNPALTLISETAGQHSENYKQRDGDGGVFAYGYAQPVTLQNPYGIGDFGYLGDGTLPVDPVELQEETVEIFSQELRLKYDAGGRLKALGGLYFTREHESEDNFTFLVFRNVRPLVVQTAAGFGLTGATANLLASFYSNDAPLYTFNAQPVSVTNYAAYGEGEFEATERLTLAFGLRYDHEENTSRITNSGLVLGLANPAQLAPISPQLAALAAGINAALDPFAEAEREATQTFHAWLPKASVRYDLTEDVSVGAVAQRAYRAGGVSVNVVRQLVTPLKPEYTWNYELFLRSELFDKRARFNANLYYVDWKDLQVTIDLSDQETDSIGANAGQAELYGFELQGDFDVSRNLKLYGGLGYSHTEFTEFDVTVPEAAAALGITVDPTRLDGLEGNSFAYAPEWTAVLGGAWQGEDGFFASANANYQSTSFADTGNTRKNEARTLVNVKAGYDFGRVTGAVFVRNLFDVDYVKDANAARPLLGEPRVFGVSLEARY